MTTPKFFRVLAWALTVLAIASAAVLCVVSIADMVSRNETAYLDGGGRHVVEMVSPKLAEGD